MIATKFALLSLLVATASAARPVSNADLQKYTFEQFVEDFHLQYPASELANRRAIFNDEVGRVLSHNAQNLSWKMGINKFSAMTAEEKKGFLGRSKGAASEHKPKNLKAPPADFTLRPLSELPENVDWRDSGEWRTQKKSNFIYVYFF